MLGRRWTVWLWMAAGNAIWLALGSGSRETVAASLFFGGSALTLDWLTDRFGILRERGPTAS